MKRSEINALIEDAKAFMSRHGFKLPPFAYWPATGWKTIGPEADEIRHHRLGWDVTDFGSGDFASLGLLLFTVRNGLLGPNAVSDKTYAEKIMVVREGQVTPYHFHSAKTEDIINRGGGVLELVLYNSTPDGQFAKTDVVVSCDGVKRTVQAGGKVLLHPGESITLVPGMYHTFYGQKGSGKVLVGEVSSVNDDATDNRFHQPLPRFPAIEEDAAPVHFLCNEYPGGQ